LINKALASGRLVQGGLEHPEILLTHDPASPFETVSKATVAQRIAIEPLCECFTRRTRSREAEWPLSIKFVVPRHRRSSLRTRWPGSLQRILRRI
jgi:hypothetical protein